uniref:EGF-like domain-containing protein n=1 Tax=Chrysemys picta bellii TaxID=8478 RepID=A0A8C3FDH7_CHRPI
FKGRIWVILLRPVIVKLPGAWSPGSCHPAQDRWVIQECLPARTVQNIPSCAADIDECQGPSPADCGTDENCTNMAGNYSCSCINGYKSSSGKANFTHASENTCQDIDECQQNATICEPHGTCINMPGSYMCKCSWGFGKSQKDTSKICTDIDECRKTPDICGPNATCINTYGSYRCECRAGYIPSNRNTTLCEGGSSKHMLGSSPAQLRT